ncbi:TetR/AcrR family transcriptional regulator [Nocardia sp. NBC_00565]|uniref:TetR/AcrR family transcriptional regulator n=1 Tax=Nocardia sp. NBC_00565 TaxID=2975993 RepID=UPI002E818745|nr:helix-turn-helix domain-containing protein [Nocardia sp. NBC_00565]WUC07027.1 TetR/AcrR family transcriptional regulator [Nocardia sp. NBC_00565]
MGRLSRNEQQQRNRDNVLAAACAEFAERGFRGATVDGIAERANLTRGAVYSNFPGKRALFLAVLAEEAERAAAPVDDAPPRSPSVALGRFARTWIAHLPRSANYPRHGKSQLQSPMLAIDLVPELMDTELLRGPFAQLIKLDAVLLGHSLGMLEDGAAGREPPGRWLGVAESVLTVLYGATQLSFVAPEFVDPAKIATVCEQMVHLRLDDPGPPVLRAEDTQAADVDEVWAPPTCLDLVRAVAADLHAQGMVAVLGVNKLGAAEIILRMLPINCRITVAMVTADAAEVAPLARLAIADLGRSLRAAFPQPPALGIQVVLDESGDLARACGVDAVDDDSEMALLIDGGRVTARAAGRGACAAIVAKMFVPLRN